MATKSTGIYAMLHFHHRYELDNPL